jgi:hypothetical protein
MKNAVFWDDMPCGSCKDRHFGGMSVLTEATWRNIPENGILHSHHCENLKSYMVVNVWVLYNAENFMICSENI